MSHSTINHRDFPFLQGGGEAGRLIRSYDWSAAPWGAPAQWPQSLRTTMGLFLQTPVPMLLFGGHDLFCLCNEAFRLSPGLQDGTLQMGGNGVQLHAGIRQAVAPLVSRVMATGEPAVQEGRAAAVQPQEGPADRWAFSCNALFGHDNAIDGVLVSCIDRGSGPVHDLQPEESGRQLAFIIDAAELGTWALNPVTGDFTANARLKGWLGLRPDEEVSLAQTLDLIAVQDRQRVADAIARELVYETAGHCDMVYTIMHPHTGKPRIVHARGQAAFDPATRKAYHLKGILQDITEQQEAERALAESEARFRSIVEQSPMAIGLLHGRDMVIAMANRVIMDHWGKDDRIIGQQLLTALPELEGQPFPAILNSVYETGRPYFGHNELARLERNGKLENLYFDYAYTPLLDAAGAITGVMVLSTDVTEQVIARQKIEDSELRLRTLIHSAPAAIGMFMGRDLVVRNPNRTFIDVIGRGPDIEGKPLRVIMPELEHQPFLQILDEVFVTGKMFQAFGARLEVAGEHGPIEKYFNIAFSPIFDEAGAVIAILDISIDVTAQVLAQQQLAASEAKLRSIIAAAPAGIGLFVGRDLVIEYPNQTFIDIVGKGPGVEGLPLQEAMPELVSEGQPFLQILDDVFTTGKMFQSFGSLVKIVQNGVMTSNYYNITYTPIFDAQGQVYAILDIAIDVTDQVKAQQQLEETEAYLRDSIELAALGTWSLDIASGNVHYSQRILDWFGLAGETETLPDVLAAIAAQDRDQVAAAIGRAVTPGTDGIFDVEYTVTSRKDGRRRILHALGKAVYNSEGIPVRLNGTAQDITIQRQLQVALEHEVQLRTEELAAANEELMVTNEELAEANDSLVHSNEELAQYAYVASHDLQEPLRKIRIFSDMLSKQEDLSGDSRPLVEKISQSAARMSLLIKDLLEFSRLLKSDMLKRPVDLNAVLEAVTVDFELVIREKQARLHIDMLPIIDAVGLQMNQLFYNLLSNALKFTAPGIPPVIQVSCRPIMPQEVTAYIPKPMPFAHYYHITFTDNGIGFDTRYAEQIFEVFKRLHGRDLYPGSGIGLALCRRIVANHQGHLFAVSEAGGGTVFHIILPDRQHDGA